MVNTLKRYTVNNAIKEHRVMLIAPLSKLKEVYDFKCKYINKSTAKDFGFKDYPFIKRPAEFYEYAGFIRRTFIIYSVYKNVKNVKSFDEMIKKMEKLSLKDIFGKEYNETVKFYDFSKGFEEHYVKYFEVYIITKLLKFKPNKKFELIFEKVCKLLEDKKWW